MNQEFLITWIGLAATGLAAVVIYTLRWQRQTKYQKSLSKTALAFNGTLGRSQKDGAPQIVFSYQDVAMSLCFVPMKTARIYLRPPLSCLRASFPFETEYRLTICPRRGRPAASNNMTDDFIRLAAGHFNAVFREKYDVYSNNSDFAASVLTRDVQERLVQCARYGPVFAYSRKKLEVGVPLTMPQEEMILELVDVSKAVAARIKQIGDYQ